MSLEMSVTLSPRWRLNWCDTDTFHLCFHILCHPILNCVATKFDSLKSADGDINTHGIHFRTEHMFCSCSVHLCVSRNQHKCVYVIHAKYMREHNHMHHFNFEIKYFAITIYFKWKRFCSPPFLVQHTYSHRSCVINAHNVEHSPYYPNDVDVGTSIDIHKINVPFHEFVIGNIRLFRWQKFWHRSLDTSPPHPNETCTLMFGICERVSIVLVYGCRFYTRAHTRRTCIAIRSHWWDNDRTYNVTRYLHHFNTIAPPNTFFERANCRIRGQLIVDEWRYTYR